MRDQAMKARKAVGLLLVFGAAQFITVATAATSTAGASKAGGYAALDTLPDWSGVWIIPEQEFVEALFAETDPSSPRAPALQPDGVAKLSAYLVRRSTGEDPPGAEPLRTNSEQCLPAGMPGVMVSPIGIEFLFSPGRVTLISEEGPTVRRIYTNSAMRPKDEEPSFAGSSVGHWEGKTLVVETTNILPRAQLIATVPVSEQARVTERIFLKNPTQLQIDTVVVDPKVLKAPWRYTRLFKRIDPPLHEYVCLENNRDRGGEEPDLTPPP